MSRKELALKAIREHPGCTARQLENLYAVKPGTIWKVVYLLVRDGIVRKEMRPNEIGRVCAHYYISNPAAKIPKELCGQLFLTTEKEIKKQDICKILEPSALYANHPILRKEAILSKLKALSFETIGRMCRAINGNAEDLLWYVEENV